MTEEKWETIKSDLKDKFDIIEDRREPIELNTLKQKGLKAYKDILIFTGPLGKMKLEYIVKPVVLDKKEHYSTRIGTSAQTEFIYSEDEYTRRVDVFKEKDGNWEKIEYNTFNLS